MKEYRFDTDGKALNEIAHHEICKNAAFRLDKPLHITTFDLFGLEDGHWFLLSDGEKRHIEGRWVTPKIEAIPEKAAPPGVHPVLLNVENE